MDISGNVWEWISDTYDGDENEAYKILRGGSWNDDPIYCRLASRHRYFPGLGGRHRGFRLLRTMAL